ncbi:MAG: hypothetical protein WD770_00075 [Actinomycetota bacterium]
MGHVERRGRIPRDDLEDLGEQGDAEQLRADRDARPHALAAIAQDAHRRRVQHPLGLALPIDERPPGAISAGRQSPGDDEPHPVVDWPPAEGFDADGG